MSLLRILEVVRSRIGEKGSLSHSVGTLVGGTAFAQAFTVLALPILTRLYTPAEFSVLAVYVAVLGTISVAACLRLEIAIPLPENDEDAINLLALALGVASVLAIIFAILVFFLGDSIALWMRIPELSPYLWMIPVGMFLASGFAATQYWSTRKRKFTRIARTRMMQAVGGVGVQAVGGFLGGGAFSLLLGHLVSGGAGFFGLLRDVFRQDGALLRAVKLREMGKMLKRYSRFPKYSTIEAFSNTAGIQVPVVVIASLAIGPEAGFLMLATKVMAAPMSLVGGALAQVYLAHAPQELRAKNLSHFTSKILTGLLKTGVGPILFVGVVAGPLTGIVFGKGWGRVGELIGWMTPWFVLQFLSSPVSMVMHVKGLQAKMLALTVFGLMMRLGTVVLSHELGLGHLSEFYAAAGGLFYFTCFIVFYWTSEVGTKQMFGAIVGAAPILALWAGAGVIVRVMTEVLI